MFLTRSLSKSKTRLLIVFLISYFIIVNFSGCQKHAENKNFEMGKAFYVKNQIDDALPYFEQAIRESDGKAEYHAYLAETYRRLDKKSKAKEEARKALRINPGYGFAHMVLANIYNPRFGHWEEANSDSTWSHLLKAVQCDSSDGNAWTKLWSEAIQRDQKDLEKKAVRNFMRCGFFTPSLLAYTRWVMSDLPRNAILLTNGDMDTYPTVALQQVEHFRSDVVIVNLSLLNTLWYARHVKNQYQISLPVTDNELDRLKPYKDKQDRTMLRAAQIVWKWMEQHRKGILRNPIAIAPTVYPDRLPPTGNQWAYAGAFLLWQSHPPFKEVDASLLRKGLNHLNVDDFKLPLVSSQDRSSIRMAYTDQLLNNISQAALTDADLLIQSGKFSEAKQRLEWIERFEKNTVLGSVSREKIEKLRETIKSKR